MDLRFQARASESLPQVYPIAPTIGRHSLLALWRRLDAWKAMGIGLCGPSKSGCRRPVVAGSTGLETASCLIRSRPKPPKLMPAEPGQTLTANTGPTSRPMVSRLATRGALWVTFPGSQHPPAVRGFDPQTWIRAASVLNHLQSRSPGTWQRWEYNRFGLVAAPIFFYSQAGSSRFPPTGPLMVCSARAPLV